MPPYTKDSGSHQQLLSPSGRRRRWLPRWQALTRVLLIFGLVTFALILYAAISDRRELGIAEGVRPGDPDVIMESIGSELIQSASGADNFLLEATKQLTYSDGSVRFIDGVRLLVPEQPDRESFTVTGDEAFVNEGQTSFRVVGEVQFSTAGGIAAKTGTASFTRERDLVAMHDEIVPTTIARAGLEASGGEVFYDRKTKIIKLEDSAEVALLPDTARALVEISSARAELAEIEHYMFFEGDTVIHTGALVVQAQEATAYFGEEQTALDRLELRGDAKVSSSDGTLSDMRADEVTLLFEQTTRQFGGATLNGRAYIELVGHAGLGSSIDATTASISMTPSGLDVMTLDAMGKVHLHFPRSETQPEQQIRSEHLVGTGTPQVGLTTLRFQQDVEYRESSDSGRLEPDQTRVITAELLEAGADPSLSSLPMAAFRGNVLFEDDDRRVEAPQIEYDVISGILTLGTTRPDDSLNIGDAATPDVTLGVPPMTEPDPGSSNQVDSATIGNAATPNVTQDVSAVPGPNPVSDRVESPVNERLVSRLTDATSTIEATMMSVSLDGSAMAATGNLQSVLTPSADNIARDTTEEMPALLDSGARVNISAESLKFDGLTESAVYEGSARLWQGPISFVGDSLTLDRRLGGLAITGNAETTIELMRLNEAAQQEEVSRTQAGADSFIYDNASYHARYDGGATLRSESGDLKADTISVFLEPDGRTLDRMEAMGSVMLRLDGRWATGESLVYFESDGRYEMEGTPVEIVEEVPPDTTGTVEPARPSGIPEPPACRTTSGRTLTFYRGTDSVAVDGREQLRTESITGACIPLSF